MRYRKGDVLYFKPTKKMIPIYSEPVIYVQRSKASEVWIRDLEGKRSLEIHHAHFLDDWYCKVDKEAVELFKLLFCG